MNRRNVLSAALAAAFLSLPDCPAWADDSPVAIVRTLYKVSAGKDGKYSGGSAFIDAKIRARYFSARLVGELAALEKKSNASNEVRLDFDPITNSQDPSVTNLKIEQDGESDGEAGVKASFSSHGDPGNNVVRFIFVREKNAWRLDNMTGVQTRSPENTAWDLRKLIATITKEFGK